MKTERLLKIGTTLTVCRYPSRRIVNQSLLWKRLLLLKKQNPNIRELPETQLNIHGAWYGKSGPDMVGRGPAGAWYGGCNMVWNVPTLVRTSDYCAWNAGIIPFVLRVHQRAFRHLIYPNILRYLSQHGVVGVRTGNVHFKFLYFTVVFLFTVLL